MDGQRVTSREREKEGEREMLITTQRIDRHTDKQTNRKNINTEKMQNRRAKVHYKKYNRQV